MSKESLRQNLQKQRRELDSEYIENNSKAIVELLFSWPRFQQANKVMAYLSMPGEPQMDAVIECLLNRGKTVCVPFLLPAYGFMEAAVLNSLQDITSGRLGLRMPNPSGVNFISPGEIDIILVPGVAFDKSGNRLGMGAGYYDRFLEKASKADLVGIAWGFQIIDCIPKEKHDISMQWLITEDGIYDCTQGKI